jgi:hypothetical protein
MNCLIVPFSIQSETIEHRSELIVTPSNGRILGWRRCLQITASLQNFWVTLSKKVTNRVKYEEGTDSEGNFVVAGIYL